MGMPEVHPDGRETYKLMAIVSLGYLGIHSSKLADWSEFASGFLGMQIVDRTAGAVSCRMDDQMQRLFVSGQAGDKLGFIGWEVAKKGDLQVYAERLETAGTSVKMGTAQLASQRFVEDLIVCDDPAGNRLELFYGPMRETSVFVPGRPHSGFRTGPFGLGHVVLHVAEVNRLLPFYRDVLDFKLSDYGFEPIPLYFFHVNGRHHSFALVESGQVGFHHFMIEFNSLDDVGQGYDLAHERGEESIAYSLGRHTNDYMTSFYIRSPSGFLVENGWGGRVIDPETWFPQQTTSGPSFWGHERFYLPEDERSKFRNMRLALALQGKQAPPMADCPWMYEPTPKLAPR